MAPLSRSVPARGTAVLIVMLGLLAVAMLVPAVAGFAMREHEVARSFAYSALIFGVITAMMRFADRGAFERVRFLEHPFLIPAAAFVLLPPVMAVPMVDAVPGLRWIDAWFEVVSAFTTTGASIFVVPRDLPATVHLWRGLLGWLGGLFVLVYAMALLAPLNLGGFDLLRSHAPAIGRKRLVATMLHTDGPGRSIHDTPASRMYHFLGTVGPAYAGLTLVLWVLLVAAGNPPLLSVMQAMATLSTSGILPARGMGPAGPWAEILIAVFLVFALSRRMLPGALAPIDGQSRAEDPELRLGLLLVVIVTFVMLSRHWIAAIEVAEGRNLGSAISAAWGSFFTALSFLTTTGFVATEWVTARAWSGLTSPGLILVGLAMVGGGVATTAGGLKLMRVFALFWQGKHELERLVYPSSMGGDGPRLRRLRSEGAFSAWLFLMLFLFSLMSLVAVLILLGQGMEQSVVLAVASLANTGPLAQVAMASPLSWAELGDPEKAVLAFAMVLGRVELLLLLSIIWPRLNA